MPPVRWFICFKVTGDEAYLARARKTARFLVDAWDERLRTFPFEHPSPRRERPSCYFFDCGIIIRGLLAVWRETKSLLIGVHLR